AQVDHQFRGDAIVILNEPRRRPPGELAARIADELLYILEVSREEALNRSDLVTTEVEAAPRVVGVGINLDVRKLAAKPQAVLAMQIRETVLQIVVGAGTCFQGTAAPTAQPNAASGAF